MQEWLQFEGRFKHLFVNGNEQIVEEIQAEVDRRWEMLLARSETKAG